MAGNLPTAGDDLLCWICGRLNQADGVATAEAVLAHVEGKPERVIRIVSKMSGRRVEGASIMLPKPGKPEDVVPGRRMARDLRPVPEGEGLIGVEPVVAEEVIATVLGYGTAKLSVPARGGPAPVSFRIGYQRYPQLQGASWVVSVPDRFSRRRLAP